MSTETKHNLVKTCFLSLKMLSKASLKAHKFEKKYRVKHELFNTIYMFSKHPQKELEELNTDLNDIEQSDDIWMINPLQDKDLGHKTILQFLTEAAHRNFLDRHLRSMNSMPRMPDHREWTRPNLPTNQIVRHHPSSPCRMSHTAKP